MMSSFKDNPSYSKAVPVERLSHPSQLTTDSAKRHQENHEPLMFSITAEPDSTEWRRWAEIDRITKLLCDEVMPVTYHAQTSKAPDENVRFHDFIEKICSDGYQASVRRLYIEQKQIPKSRLLHFREFFDYIEKFDRVFSIQNIDQISRFFLFFAGKYSLTECHEHGGHEALLCQLSGRKEVLLHEPTRENFQALYADPLKYENWSPVHPIEPNLRTYPKYSSVTSHYAQVEPGQVLYIPDGWYHSVASMGDDPSVGITYFYPQRFLDFQAEPRRLHFKKILENAGFEEKRKIVDQIYSSPRTVRSLADARKANRSFRN